LCETSRHLGVQSLPTRTISPKTTNVHDPVGNLASVKDGNNHLTAYTYDAAGRILTVTAPDGGVTTYTYDDAGNTLTRTDDNDHTASYAYDDAGRLLSETGPIPTAAARRQRPLRRTPTTRMGTGSP